MYSRPVISSQYMLKLQVAKLEALTSEAKYSHLHHYFILIPTALHKRTTHPDQPLYNVWGRSLCILYKIMNVTTTGELDSNRGPSKNLSLK